MGRWLELGLLAGIGAIAAALAVAAGARSALETIGNYQAWSAATFTDDGVRTCYAVSTPTESTPKNVRRGNIYVMVSRRSPEQTDEFMLVSGYPFKEGSQARVTIGSSSFILTTGNEFAWMPVGKQAEPLVDAMVSGQQMIVEGVSARGTATTDRYSLVGFTAAHKAVVKRCK